MAKKVKRKLQRGQKEKRGSEQNDPAKAETVEYSVAEKEKKVCIHFDNGIDLATVTSKISSAEPIKCGYCRVGVSEKRANKVKDKQGKKKGGSSVDSKAQSKAIWVCLQCGSFYCGGIGFPTVPQSHAVLHAKQTHHQLAIQYENVRLRWCFPCNTLIPVEKSGESGELNDPLSDIVKVIKGRSSTEKVTVNSENGCFGSGSILGEIKSENSLAGLEGTSGYSVRGLLNLGNTCFFNSILQNLLVLDRLRDHYLGLDESVGPLTVSLRKIFIESITGPGLRNLINPRAFFGSICAKAPQFRGFQQHDSHELLRCLLDGLCTEELSAKKRVSLENGTSANQEPTFVDAIFGGQLSSTVSCLDCGHSSKVFEPFLDLSLPVPTKRPPSKKANKPISRAKKQKPPPKRNGRYRPKGSNDGSPSAQPSVPTSSVNHEPLAKPPSDAHDYSVGPYVVTETKSSGSLNLKAVDECENNPLLECADDSSWLDYLKPDFRSNDNETTSKCNGIAANHDTDVKDDGQTKESVPDGKESSNQVVVGIAITTGLEPDIVSHEVDTTSTCNDIAAYCDSGEKDDGQTNKSVQDGMESSCQNLEGVVATTDLSENSTWLDFVGSSEVIDDHDIVSEVNDSSVQASRGEITQAASVTQSICAESYCSPGNSFENDHPLQVQGSEVILLPYNEGSCCNGEILPGEGEVSSLAIGCDPEFLGFDGFGDLFNEPEILEGPSVKPMSSESDPDEVDNSNSQVSVEGCLAYFIKPELLSTSEHGWNCDNCSKSLQKQRRLSRKNLRKDAKQNGVEDRVNSPPDSGLDSPCPSEVGNLSNGDIPDLVSSEVDYEDACRGNVPNIAVGSADELQHNESSGGFESEGNGVENVKVKRDATKSIFIDKAPSLLTIHLKRFCQDGRGRLSKLNGHVDFKDTIDLRPYMDPRCQEMEEYKYRLSGVVVHSGSMRGGHYVAYVRGSKKSHDGAGSIWYHTSDAHVQEVSLQEVLNCEAYILFYEKIY